MTIHDGGPARLVYLGTPEIAVRPLEALVASGHDVALVVTNPDRRRGRGKELMPTPVKAAAERLGVPVSHDIDEALTVGADLGVVVAFGHIIRSHVLDALPLVNIHFSLLPRWRGAAPLERAILAGDAQTGVCLMQIVEALDEGAVYARRTVPVGDSTLDELRDALVDASCDLLVEALADGFVEPEPQVGEPVYARKIKPEEHQLDFARPAVEVVRVTRLGRAWTTLAGKRLRVLGASVDTSPTDGAQPGEVRGDRVATGDGWLVLERVQPEGKKAVDAADWLRGARIDPGTRLGG
ncbi:MAG: methionyl-tRNA formyltransferase [Actinomycetota bacterium]